MPCRPCQRGSHDIRSRRQGTSCEHHYTSTSAKRLCPCMVGRVHAHVRRKSIKVMSTAQKSKASPSACNANLSQRGKEIAPATCERSHCGCFGVEAEECALLPARSPERSSVREQRTELAAALSLEHNGRKDTNMFWHAVRNSGIKPLRLAT